MTILARRLAQATECLAAVSDTPRLDAEILMAHSLQTSRAQLLARLREDVPAPGYEELVERRLAYEPIAYIVGTWEFYSLDFLIEPPVLVPRPETEHLVEVVLAFIGNGRARVLDVGTGSGCVAVALAKNAPSIRMVATDIDPHNLDLARRNAQRHRVADRIDFRCGDLFAALEEDEQTFDVICSNPPYVEESAWPQLSPVIRLYEDPRALLAGAEGLEIIRRLAEGARGRLAAGDLLAFEIGMGQIDAVRSILLSNAYEEIAFCPDLAGIPRVAYAKKTRGQ